MCAVATAHPNSGQKAAPNVKLILHIWHKPQLTGRSVTIVALDCIIYIICSCDGVIDYCYLVKSQTGFGNRAIAGTGVSRADRVLHPTLLPQIYVNTPDGYQSFQQLPAFYIALRLRQDCGHISRGQLLHSQHVPGRTILLSVLASRAASQHHFSTYFDPSI